MFRLGKIKSKYLILEMLSYAEHSGSAAKLLHDSSTNLRRLFCQNYGAFSNIMSAFKTIEITKFSELLCSQLIRGKYLSIEYTMMPEEIK